MIKHLRTFALTMFFLFGFLLIVFVIYQQFTPRILISNEYNQKASPFALIVSVFFCSSVIYLWFSEGRKAKRKDGKLKIGIFITNLPLVFLIFAVGLSSYTGVLQGTTIYFHQSSPKESVEMEVVVNSARPWPFHGDFRGDCKYIAVFNNPVISLSAQHICLNYDQWNYFRDVKKPITVVLYGMKSYYGYELKCCK